MQTPSAGSHNIKQRTFYFSKKEDPKDPDKAEFYLVEQGQPQTVFNPDKVNVSVNSGAVEDWTIENRDDEAHVFHIHQLHFLLRDYHCPEANTLCEANEVAEDDQLKNTLRDTITISGTTAANGPYPSVTLRMDFRDPEIKGKFPYHCHILEHEDKGMMGIVEVK